MNPVYDNFVTSSFLLWLDHNIIKYGQAYTNHSSYFYPTDNPYNGYYAYSAPFNQFITDTSLVDSFPGINIFSGVYLDGSFIPLYQSGLAAIDPIKGRVYFTGQITGTNRISGNYAIKDFNLYVTSRSEDRLLFENQLTARPKISKTVTGLYDNEKQFPVIFLKSTYSMNEPWAFGGTVNTKHTITAYVFSDTEFKLDALKSICRDLAETDVPLLDKSEYPGNPFEFTTFNYDSITTGKILNGNSLFVRNVAVFDVNRGHDRTLKQINNDSYLGLMEFEIEGVRQPRVIAAPDPSLDFLVDSAGNSITIDNGNPFKTQN